MEKKDIYLSLEDIILKILNKNNIEEAIKVLLAGGLLAFPTETVYGLGVLATSKDNYDKLVKAKNRHPDKPFTLMISKTKQVEKYLEVNDLTRKIIDKCMPGALTLILKAKMGVPDYVDHGTGFVGIRMPDDKFVLDLIDTVDEPLFVPSCNKADEPPCINALEVKSAFKDELDACIDGNCNGGVPSTIIKVDGDKITLIRQGNLKLEDIMEAIK